MTVPTVVLYQDYVQNHVFMHQSLCRHFGSSHVLLRDAADIIDGCLSDHISLFIMPGGDEQYYQEKLEGKGNEEIRRFVESGGTYLGVCRGASYACTDMKWGTGSMHETVHGSGDLCFYNGRARAPIAEFIEDPDDLSRSLQGVASLSFDDGDMKLETQVMYHGGPMLDGDENAKILARYAGLEGSPAAIVECTIKKGRAILCSPHLEIASPSLKRRTYHHNNASHDWEASLPGKLAAHDNDNGKLWAHLLDYAIQPG